jgi:NitT/TauT family transport system substrate-binding protein
MLDLKMEAERFEAAIEFTMRNPHLKRAGIGAVEAGRLKKAIAMTAELSGVSVPADPAEIYTEAFLPPATDRLY